jgi:hypothetical protein
LVSQSLNSPAEANTFNALDEADDVAAERAAIAVERIAVRIDIEIRPTAIGMERTTSNQSAPARPKLYAVVGDDIRDRVVAL